VRPFVHGFKQFGFRLDRAKSSPMSYGTYARMNDKSTEAAMRPPAMSQRKRATAPQACEKRVRGCSRPK